jgi:hypothetical protein
MQNKLLTKLLKNCKLESFFMHRDSCHLTTPFFEKFSQSMVVTAYYFVDTKYYIIKKEFKIIWVKITVEVDCGNRVTYSMN